MPTFHHCHGIVSRVNNFWKWILIVKLLILKNQHIRKNNYEKQLQDVYNFALAWTCDNKCCGKSSICDALCLSILITGHQIFEQASWWKNICSINIKITTRTHKKWVINYDFNGAKASSLLTMCVTEGIFHNQRN